MGVLSLPTVEAKPEEIIERTDPLKGQFSPSSYGEAECPRKFYFSKILKLRSSYISPPLVYGSAIHKGVEFFYKNTCSKTLSFEEVQIGAVQEFTEEWSKSGLFGDEKRSLEGGIHTIGKYCDTYRDDSTEFEEADIEGAQWVPMPNGTMLLMKLDRIAKQGPAIGVIDTKTSSWALTDFYFRKYEQDMQVSLYYYGMETLVGRCDFIIIDGILVPYPKVGSKSIPFVRRNFFRTEYQIEEAVNSYCRKTDWVMKGIEIKDDEKQRDYFYQNQQRCADYGGCKFKSICIHGMEHPAIGTDFIMGVSNEKRKESS